MELHILVNGKEDFEMAREYKSGQTELSMKTIELTEKENLYMLIKMSMKVIGQMIKQIEEDIDIKTKLLMTNIGKKIFINGKVLRNRQMDVFIWESILRVRNKDMGFINRMMDLSMKEWCENKISGLGL